MLISLEPYEGGKLVARIATHLGERFPDYLEAVKACGGTYVAASKANIFSLHQLPYVLDELHKRGFQTKLTSELITRTQELSAKSKTLEREAADRLVSVKAELAKRGMYLFPFQELGILVLSSKDAFVLADEQGCGKTVQALVAAATGVPVLVVCPAIAKGVWAREAGRWRPDLTVNTLSGQMSFRPPVAGELLITNYDILPLSKEELEQVQKEVIELQALLARLTEQAKDSKTLEADLKHLQERTKAREEKLAAARRAADLQNLLPGTVLIADEAHGLKNSKTQRYARFTTLSKEVRLREGKVWLLTGTPILNNPMEGWCVLAAAGLEKQAFGNWPRFIDLFRGQKNTFGGYTFGIPTKEVGECLKRVMLRRERKEVLPQLPTKLYTSIEVDISDKDRAGIDKILAEMRAQGIHWEQALAQVHHAGEVAEATPNKTVPFQMLSAARQALAAAKIPAMMELVELYSSYREPLVVFSAYKTPVEFLGRKSEWAQITGDTPPNARTQIEEAFQEGKLKGVAGTIKATGVAITLTRSHIGIFVDEEWTPALNAQAQDRICRIGQDRGVQIIRLYANHPLDRRIHELLTAKQELIDHSVSAARITPKQASSVMTQSESLNKVLTGTTSPMPTANKRHIKPQSLVELQRSLEMAPITMRRTARSKDEFWAATGIAKLTDGYLTDSDPQFQEAHSSFGMTLQGQLAMGLSEAQWEVAVRLCLLYPALGPRPV